MTKEELIKYIEDVVISLGNKTKSLQRELVMLKDGTSPYLSSVGFI